MSRIQKQWGPCSQAGVNKHQTGQLRSGNTKMKTNSRDNCSIALAVAATLMGRIAILAQDWETVDDFAPAGGNAEAHGVVVDAAGRIYVVGTANGHGIVRGSADGGTSWTTQDDFLYPGEANNLFNAVVVDSSGAVFVGGASGGHWIVRRSSDQGTTWMTVDDFFAPRYSPTQEGTNGAVYSLSSDGQGRVYGAGLMRPTGPSYNSWWVRGSSIGGGNWDTKLLLFSGYNRVSQIACSGEDVFVTGSVDSASDAADWLILKSSGPGATWTTNFEGIGDVQSAITADSAGYLYTAGAHLNNSTSVVWLVRQAAPGGTNWTTLDRSLYDEGDTSGRVDQPVARSIAVDAGGNVCAAGEFISYWVNTVSNGTMYGNDTTWFTREYLATEGQWSTTDLFSYSTNRQGGAMGAAIAPSGSAFVAGYGTSDSGQRRWVVRRRAPPGPPPRLQIAWAGGHGAVSWPAAYTNVVLQWTDSRDVNTTWQNFTGRVDVVNGLNTAAFGLTPAARFFRLNGRSSP